MTALREASAELVPAPPYVTVVLPCFNEQEHVLLEVERISAALDASGYPYELLVIDDASTDGTLAVLQQAASPAHGAEKSAGIGTAVDDDGIAGAQQPAWQPLPDPAGQHQAMDAPP